MSTANRSYEAWKESLKQAEASGDEEWSEELGEAGGPVLRRPGAMEGNGLTAVLASVGLLIVGAGILLPKFKHLTVGERTVGVVIGHQGYGYGSTGSIRVPIVRYSGPGGVYDTRGFLPAAQSTYPLGKEVWVLYLRNEPRSAVIADFVQLFLIPTLVGGLGLICLTGTTVFMYWTVRGELRFKTPFATRREFVSGDQPAAANEVADSDVADNADAKDDVASIEELSADDATIDGADHSNSQRECHAVAQG